MFNAILKRTRIPILKAALKLPSFLTRPLSAPITENEGVELDGRLRWFLRVVSLDSMTEAQLSVQAERTAYREIGNSALAGPRLNVDCNDEIVPGSPPIAIRIYRPKTCAPKMPSIFWMHGGGWMIGDLETHDRFCRRLCTDANVIVIAADYRRCPEHQFPAPLSDVTKVWQWLIARAEPLGLDRSRMALGGDSAGGNMAAVLCQELPKADLPCLQVLCYPCTDMVNRHPSRDRYADGFFLNESLIRWFMKSYLKGADPASPRLSPLLNEHLTNQPPVILITAGLDPLCDEGRAYGAKLAGLTSVTHHHEPTQIHGFITLTGALPEADKAVGRLCVALKSQLKA
jgi:acetyl esterase